MLFAVAEVLGGVIVTVTFGGDGHVPIGVARTRGDYQLRRRVARAGQPA